ncbi:MAG: histidine kinase [Bacteroidota bacterium]
MSEEPFSRKSIIRASLLLLILSLLYILYRLELSNTVYFTLLWIVVVAVLLLVGNKLIANILNRKFPWMRYGTYRFVLHLLLGIFYSLFVINFAYFLFKSLLTTEPPIMSQIIVTNVYGTGIFIPLFSIYFSLYFLRHWRESFVATEAAKKENIKAQLSSLKDHLDPHFLFNNLNILSSLIEIDTDRSQKFLSEFADVYRAILLSKNEDLIALSKELEFMDSYIYLIKTRFRDDIEFKISVAEDYHQYMLPPLSIQMLVENAVKHNKITETRPLTISIETDESGLLKVKNNINLQVADESRKSGSGLNNLRGRYAPFTDMEITIMADDAYFEVNIPLLATENI